MDLLAILDSQARKDRRDLQILLRRRDQRATRDLRGLLAILGFQGYPLGLLDQTGKMVAQHLGVRRENLVKVLAFDASHS